MWKCIEHTAKGIHRKQNYIFKAMRYDRRIYIFSQNAVYYIRYIRKYIQYHLKIGFPSSSLNQRIRLGCSLDDVRPVLVSQGSVALCPATTFIDVPFTSVKMVSLH